MYDKKQKPQIIIYDDIINYVFGFNWLNICLVLDLRSLNHNLFKKYAQFEQKNTNLIFIESKGESISLFEKKKH